MTDENDTTTGGTERSLGRCNTEGCHRDAVVTHRHSDPENMSGLVEVELCLPCRRVVDHARGIPWNDEDEEWADVEALRDYIDGGDVDRRYVGADTSP